MTRPIRTLALAAALALTAGLAPTAPSARAQEAEKSFFDVPQSQYAEDGEGGGGDPVPGYLATSLLAGAVIFVLCKSARR